MVSRWCFGRAHQVDLASHQNRRKTRHSPHHDKESEADINQQQWHLRNIIVWHWVASIVS